MGGTRERRNSSGGVQGTKNSTGNVGGESAMDLQSLAENRVLNGLAADVSIARERTRQRRLAKLGFVGLLLGAWTWMRVLGGHAPWPGLPHLSGKTAEMAPLLLLVVILGAAITLPLLMAGRSPHVLFRSSEIDTSLEDVRGMPVVVEEVVKTLNLFLAHKTFKEEMGGNPRRGILFEGPPGTGKTYLAKAMAKQADVPFLFASSSQFQNVYFGMTNVRIRKFFKRLRKAALQEGGAIGFIEEIDTIGENRGGVAMSPAEVPGGKRHAFMGP